MIFMFLNSTLVSMGCMLIIPGFISSSNCVILFSILLGGLRERIRRGDGRLLLRGRLEGSWQ